MDGMLPCASIAVRSQSHQKEATLAQPEVTRRDVVSLLALVLFCTLWRLPGLADPPWLNDEGTYATVGRALVDGQALYRQIWENKPPGIYLLYGAMHALVGPAHLLVGVRLAALLAAAVAQLSVYALVRAARVQATALLAVALAGAGLALPLLDGTAANAEIFLAAATSTGMALLWRHTAGRQPEGGQRIPAMRPQPQVRFLPLLLAGIAFGVAGLFKLVAAADLLAALLVTAVYGGTGRLVRCGRLLLGLALPLGIVTLWLSGRGLLGEALYATVGYNRGYVATGQGMHGPLLTLATLLAPIGAAALGTWLAQRWRDHASFGAGMCWWLAAAILGALASGRSYPHYYLQAVPPAAVCVALLFEWVGSLGERKIGASFSATETRRKLLTFSSARGPKGARSGGTRLSSALLVGLLAVWAVGVPLGSWLALRHEGAGAAPGSNQAAYYAHFWQHLTGTLDDTAYGNRLDPRVERNVAVARYLREHPLAPRRLYIWGNTPWVYYLSGYGHAARFISAYYRPPIPGGMDQVLSSLRADPPPYIVVIEPPSPPSVALARLLRRGYLPVWHQHDATVYRRHR